MSFEKNYNLEEILAKVNELLEPVEQLEMDKVDKPRYHNLLLIGSPRSGSTIFTQWMASLETFSYPSNFLSRFYKAPYIGALIYSMVTKQEYQYRDEFADINDELKFSSAIGKTKGFKAPHEFWYFWREFIDFPDIPCTEEEFSNNFDFNSFQKELTLIQKAFEKPFLCKGKIVNWYLKSMGENVSDVLYLHIYRDPIATIRSLLKAREKWTGSQEKWFSWKPRQFETLKRMDRYHQVAGQIYFIEKEILLKREYLGDNYLCFSYEDFCVSPETIYLNICQKVKDLNSNFDIPDYSGEKQFQISNPVADDDKYIQEAFQYFENKYGKLKY